MYKLIFLAIVLTCTGCIHFGKTTPKYREPTVVGERILILEPGSTITVPELTSPAKKWYLVDNVSLQAWLGISTDL